MRKYSKSDEVIVIGANIKLSVIIPVYQVEKHLCACLDSVLKSQADNFEIILVDDGSKDKSPSICDEYRDRYPNIAVIHQENGGLAAARNTGIAAARGEYLTFIDSDDIVEPHYCDRIISCTQKNDDIIAFSYIVDYTQTEHTVNHMLPNLSCVDPQTALRALEEAGAFNMVCFKVYKRALLSAPPHISFQLRSEPGEDLIFNCRCFERAKTLSLVDEAFYHWIRRGEDTLANKFRPDLYEKNLMFIEYRNRLYQSLKMERTDIGLLSKGNLSYIFSCVPNMYRKGHVFKRRDRLLFYRDILNNPDVRKWIDNTEEKSALIRHFVRLYHKGSPYLLDGYYAAALRLRKTFDPMWQIIRKRL